MWDEQPGKANYEKISSFKPAFAGNGTITVASSATIARVSLRRRVLCADHYYASCSIPAAVGALLALHRRGDGDGFLNYYKGSNE
ncbi:hypothetical protein [Sphingobium sp. B2]|uniref:hypothetical protein n=1 Tax=Sphingobium sp. B2 TaxID=2583228 RepID=UPI0021BD4E2C|nr:hypothetical protein [Sphingobium sp. B2]